MKSNLFDYQLLINNEPIHLIYLQSRYIYKEGLNSDYRAIVPCGSIIFNTPHVIQGITTAAEWLNLDPHIFVKELIGYNNSDMIPLSF